MGQTSLKTAFDLLALLEVIEGKGFLVPRITAFVYQKSLPILCIAAKSWLLKEDIFKEIKKRSLMEGECAPNAI